MKSRFSLHSRSLSSVIYLTFHRLLRTLVTSNPPPSPRASSTSCLINRCSSKHSYRRRCRRSNKHSSRCKLRCKRTCRPRCRLNYKRRCKHSRWLNSPQSTTSSTCTISTQQLCQRLADLLLLKTWADSVNRLNSSSSFNNSSNSSSSCSRHNSNSNSSSSFIKSPSSSLHSIYSQVYPRRHKRQHNKCIQFSTLTAGQTSSIPVRHLPSK